MAQCRQVVRSRRFTQLAAVASGVLTIVAALAALSGNLGCNNSTPPDSSSHASWTGGATNDGGIKLLKEMAKAYSEAASYDDGGELHVVVETQGRHKESPPIPLSVAFVRPNKLRLHALMAAVVCDGTNLWAVDQQIAGQVIMLPAPPRLTVDQILADPTLAQSIEGDSNRRHRNWRCCWPIRRWTWPPAAR